MGVPRNAQYTQARLCLCAIWLILGVCVWAPKHPLGQTAFDKFGRAKDLSVMMAKFSSRIYKCSVQ